MFSKILALFLIGLMFNAAGANVVLGRDSNEKNLSKSEKKIKKRAAEIKKAVNKLGSGKNSVVKLKMRDKTKIKGYIRQVDDESFTVIDERGNTHVVEYAKAKQIQGNNLHAGVWVAVGIGIALVVFLIIFQQFDS